MPNFTAGTSFTDGVTNDVTALKLNALVADAVPTSSLSLNSTTGTISLFSSGTGTAATPAIQPTGDANTGIFFPAADTIAFSEGGDERMRIDSSGRVGIGTTSPSRLLSVDNATNPEIALYNSGTERVRFSTGGSAGSRLAIDIGGAEAMRIDSSGNVGVGTTSPTANLHVVKATSQTDIDSATQAVSITNTASDTSGNLTGIRLKQDNVTNVAQGYIGLSSTGNSATRANLIIATPNTSGNSTERLRIDSSGNVGIGGTPSTLLHLQATSPSLRIQAASGNSSAIDFYRTASVNSGQIACESTNSLVFSTNTGSALVERLRIDTSGRVGIGTSSPARLLTVDNATNPEIGLYTNGTERVKLSTGGSATSQLVVDLGGVERLRIDSSGNVGIGMTPTAQLELSTDSAKKPSTNTWTIASDRRLKTNITNADNDRCYEIVKQVPLKRYTWKGEVYSQEQVKDRSKLGWIAQDVEAVFPKAVGTNRFAYNQVFEDVVTPELDSDGNAVLDENGVTKTKTEKRLVSEDVIEDCKDLNSDQIYAAMYGTIQKLIEKVELLESKVATLEAA